MSTRPSRAGARVAQLLGLPVPYAIPVVPVDDKRGFASRENAPYALVSLNRTPVDPLDHAALIFAPTDDVAGVSLRICGIFEPTGTALYRAALVSSQAVVNSSTLVPFGDVVQGTWLGADLLAAALPAIDAQLDGAIVYSRIESAFPYPEYHVDIQIPKGQILVIASAAPMVQAVMTIAHYTVAM